MTALIFPDHTQTTIYVAPNSVTYTWDGAKWKANNFNRTKKSEKAIRLIIAFFCI